MLRDFTQVFCNFACLCNRALQFDHTNQRTRRHTQTLLSAWQSATARGVGVGGLCALCNGGSDHLAPRVSTSQSCR